jgi:outer membrane protein TolC
MKKFQICSQAFVFLIFGFAAQGICEPSYTLNGKELIAYDISKKNIEKAKFSEQTIRSDYIFQVAQAYIQALNLKRLVTVAGKRYLL